MCCGFFGSGNISRGTPSPRCDQICRLAAANADMSRREDPSHRRWANSLYTKHVIPPFASKGHIDKSDSAYLQLACVRTEYSLLFISPIQATPYPVTGGPADSCLLGPMDWLGVARPPY